MACRWFPTRPPSRCTRWSDDKASVAFRGNRYSVPPGMGGTELTSSGTGSGPAALRSLRLWTSNWCPTLSPGAGAMVRTEARGTALEAVVLSQFHHGAEAGEVPT
jgi:hypothetical protein